MDVLIFGLYSNTRILESQLEHETKTGIIQELIGSLGTNKLKL